MTYSLSWMADVLRAAGCQVIDDPAIVGDWKARGHGEFGPAKGVLLHDTVGRNPPADHPSLEACIKGRPDLAGPLCNLYLSRSGAYYPIAAGKGWHAGYGSWQSVHEGMLGNSQLIGIEMENNGVNEPWLPPILSAAHSGVAALLRHIKVPAIMCAGHKEYARSPVTHKLGRKIDPDFPIPEFRESLAPYLT